MDDAMTGLYRTVDLAQKRVDALKTIGIWPGIILHADGSCTLTYDPRLTGEQA